MRFSKLLLLIQSTYFLLTGLWPLIHKRSILLVTGPKTDLWLVDMVALLVIVIGLLLLYCREEKFLRIGLALGFMSGTAFIIIDVIYVLNGTIRKIYLADALIELALISPIVFISRKIAKEKYLKEGKTR